MDFQPLRTNLQAAPHAGDLMSIADLAASERLLIFAAREWVNGTCKGICPTPTLVRAFAEAGLSAALIDLHALLTLAATAARRPLALRRPACGGVCNAEIDLLAIVAYAQKGHGHLAAARLAAWFANDVRRAVWPLAEALSSKMRSVGLDFELRPEYAEAAFGQDACHPTLQ